MTTTESIPSAVHIGAADLPFVDIGDGNKFKVIQVKEERASGSWRTSFRPATRSRPTATPVRSSATPSRGRGSTRSTTTSTGPGSFLYEPAGSVHTLQCIEDDTQVWFQMYGVNLNLDADGNVESVFDGAGTLAAYYALCEAQGLPRPNVLAELMPTAIDLSDPDTFVGGVPHEELTELRRTQPVYFQEMRDDAGFWALLGMPTWSTWPATRTCSRPVEGGVVIETLAPEQVEQMRGMLLAMDPPRHLDYRRPWPSTSGAG